MSNTGTSTMARATEVVEEGMTAVAIMVTAKTIGTRDMESAQEQELRSAAPVAPCWEQRLAAD